eukprot:m.23656 g.23656  ORF g.23656 m.23656 type:complete len:139 (-) comp7528_c0_seq1:974-1390(-)
MADAEKEPSNVVHIEARMVETIKKEQRTFSLNKEFSASPKSVSVVTGKPNVAEMQVSNSEASAALLQTIKNSQEVPTKKYSFPQTESQEIGWDARHYKRNVNSIANKPRKQSEITSYMDKYWAQMEQQKMAQATNPTE